MLNKKNNSNKICIYYNKNNNVIVGGAIGYIWFAVVVVAFLLVSQIQNKNKSTTK